MGLISATFLHHTGDVELVPLFGSAVYIPVVRKLACDHDINIQSYQLRLEALQSCKPHSKKYAESKQVLTGGEQRVCGFLTPNILMIHHDQEN